MLRRHEKRDENDLSDADWSVYLELRRKADAIRRPHLVINTATDTGSLLRRLIERLRSEEDAAD